MALNKVNIPVAAGGKHEFDLSCDHQTSMNFLLGQPIYYRHMPRGEHFTDKTLGCIRPVGMYLPTFGRVRNNLRAFFVPYRLVNCQYDAGRDNVLGYGADEIAIPVNSPKINMTTILNYFLNTVIVGVGPLVTELVDYDPTDPGETRIPDFHYNTKWYQYTAAGFRRLKLLRCLGYEPIWEVTKSSFYYDVYALLAYSQIYLDWYANSQYLDSSVVTRIRAILSYNAPSTVYVMDQSDFNAVLSLVFNVVYDTDEYFNAAWDIPVAPTLQQQVFPTVTDITSSVGATYVASDSRGTPNMYQTEPDDPFIGTQYIHDMLQALSNFQRRHALSGAREIDRALADYGFVSDYAALKRAVYIGNRTIDIQIGDVMNHAETSSTDVPNLGSYAGRGFGQGEGSFDFTASEDGILIIVSTIIPSAGIVQGYDRNNRHLTTFDMYDPNFEIGVQVLEKGEVYISPDDDFGDDMVDYTEKFGYTGRFGEYKRPRSWYTSQSRIKSMDQGGDAWNLFRLFTDDNFGGDIDNLVHSLEFTIGKDWESFNRIFNYTGSDRDKFECFYHHEVHCFSPMKPLFETYDFKEAHKAIKMDINGSKLN